MPKIYTMQQIDLHDILRKRGGGKAPLPGFVISWLERLVHQKELNTVLRATYPATGSEFCERVYDYFDLKLEVQGLENIPGNGRFIFASNHPLGGLDGIGLIKVLGAKYGDDKIAFLVNDLLMNIEPLRHVFLPINKFGSQARQAVSDIADAYAGDKQIIIFPAGLVSRLNINGRVADLQWHKSFIDKAVEYQRDIVPVHFIGLNRKKFYHTARLRTKLGVKTNLEQTMLPAELCAARGNTFKVIFGKPLHWSKLRDSDKSHETLAAVIRDYVHRMK